MIPVVTANAAGELSHQVFNDILAPVEQINRKVLAALIYAEQKLTAIDYEVGLKIGKGELTDDQIKNINTASTALMQSLEAAVKAFTDVIEA